MQPKGHRRSPVERSVAQGVIILCVFAVAGATSGLIWHLLWDPPTGVVVQGEWRVTSEDGYRAFFSATGWFVVLSAGFGVTAGLLTGFLTRERELVALASLTVGSILAAVVMWRVGLALGNPDPAVLARRAADGTLLEARISIGSWSPILAYPAAAIFGILVPFVLIPGEEKPTLAPPYAQDGPRPFR